MYKVEFKLKQHTPLIHFQHTQDDATLRASEVKPLLDKYLIDRFKMVIATENGFEIKQEFVSFFNNSKQPALGYKMKISSSIKEKIILANNIKKEVRQKLNEKGINYWLDTPYFAADEKIKNNLLDEASLGLLLENIAVEIKSFNQDLINLIGANIEDFFVLNNFGSRKSKGFGGFTLEGTKMEYFETILSNTFSRGNIFLSSFASHMKMKQIFKDLAKDYKLLKAGERGVEAALANHFQKDNLISEKKASRDLIRGGIRGTNNNLSNSNQKYIRAILGLAELFDYSQLSKKIRISSKTEEIQRFSSPIFYKVFNNETYLIATNINESIYDHEFSFKLDDRNSFNIKTPSKNTPLDLKAFLKKYLDPNNYSPL